MMQGPAALQSVVTYPVGAGRGQRIVIDGPRGAIFEYDANNNLVASWASSNGTDPYGNVYTEGLTVNAGSIIGTIFEIVGANGGMFAYDGSGNLRSAIVGAQVTDPRQGITCFPGVTTFNAFGAALNYLSTGSPGGFYQYRDLGNATQGATILTISSTTGNEPYHGDLVRLGMFGQDPFGEALQAIGSTINLFGPNLAGNNTIMTKAAPALSSINPYLQVNAPEQSGVAGHAQMLLMSTSPDGTNLPQILIGVETGTNQMSPVTNAMVEIQAQQAAPSNPVLELISLAVGDRVFGFRIPGDNDNRIKWTSDGTLSWGPGNAGQDTNIYRGAINQLKTDDAFNCTGGTAANPTLITTDALQPLGAITFANVSIAVATYSLLPDGRVWISVKGSATGAVTAGSANFANTVPAAYQPAHTTDLPVICAGTSVGRVTVSTAGVVTLQLPALVNGNRIDCQQAYDLQ